MPLNISSGTGLDLPACGFCGNPYHQACFYCHRPGIPYVYHDITFDGLIARQGERLCPACAEAAGAAEGVNILVVDDRPGIPDFVYNTVRDRDLAIIRVAPEDRGIDGRDAFHRGRRSGRTSRSRP